MDYPIGQTTQLNSARQTHVNQELEMLDKSTSILLESISAFEVRLTNVLRIGLEKTDKVSGAPAEEKVPLAGTLEELRRRIDIAADRVKDMNQRLEL